MASSYLRKTLYNNYLGTSKTITAKTLWELELKEKQINDSWAEKVKIKEEKEKIYNLKERAVYLTNKALEKNEEYKNILRFTLSINDRLDWNSQLKNNAYPQFLYNDQPPTLESCYQKFGVPSKSVLESIIKSIKEKREEKEKLALDDHRLLTDLYEKRKSSAYAEYLKRKSQFEEEQNEYNKQIMEWKKNFEEGQVEAIEKYVNVILENSKYPFGFNKEYEVQYDPNSKMVIISYFLPNTEEVPYIVAHKYVASTKEIKPVQMKVKEFSSFYEDINFQIALRTIHEIFEAIYTQYVDMVAFNGWVRGTDKSTGHDFTSCILSIQVTREEFEKINLDKIDPKTCVKQLKGIFAGPLANLAPVKPIMDINRNDKRFIESKDILADINSIPNLATMDWADFEHLVRQLFEKMFSEKGSEVRVTQASRDGGVDAIAFDPDPIKGGKIVIQAKRYNNVVPVSAVRDLYGTVINEGATKGILVTTSYFGKDSLEMVKDKPIALIDGNNLLYYFQEFGYKVRINLE